MILGAAPESLPATTLDDLFRRAVARRPDAIALADPPHRHAVTGGPPRQLTYAEADRLISTVATQLRGLGLHSDAVIGIQLPNTVESVLALLGVLRAGMIAALLPLLWRQTEIAAALTQTAATAIVTSRIGAYDGCEAAVYVAARNFAVRHVCG